MNELSRFYGMPVSDADWRIGTGSQGATFHQFHDAHVKIISHLFISVDLKCSP